MTVIQTFQATAIHSNLPYSILTHPFTISDFEVFLHVVMFLCFMSWYLNLCQWFFLKQSSPRVLYLQIILPQEEPLFHSGKKINIVVYPFPFHFFMSLVNLWYISLQGQFPILRTRSCPGLYSLIYSQRRPLALDRERIFIPRFIRFPPTLDFYKFANSLALGNIGRDFPFSEDETQEIFHTSLDHTGHGRVLTLIESILTITTSTSLPTLLLVAYSLLYCSYCRYYIII